MKNTKKIFLLFIVISLGLFAAELPLVPSTEIIIKKGKWTTVTFPFDIKDITKSPFIGKTTIPGDIDSDSVINSETLLDKDALPQPKGSTGSSSISMTKTKRSISIFPYRLGSTQLVIYGNSAYPMHLTITVENKASADHFAFVGNVGDVKEEINNFEMVTHEKVISKLVKYGYNNRVPEGYRNVSGGKSYKRNGMYFNLTKKLIGEGYQLDVWIVKNTKKGVVNLYPEMFYSAGIYAVAFENPSLNTNESTKMFVVRKKS